MGTSLEHRIDLIDRFDMAISVVGWPVAAIATILGIIVLDDKYMRIRPADAFLYIRIYGIATIVIVVLVGVVAAYGESWEACFTFGVLTQCAIPLIPLIARKILDRWLARRPV